MPTRVRFVGQSQVESESFDLAEVGDNQVHVKSICSLLSTGTETIAYARQFEAGSHWDGWVKYPFYPGYATIGRVVACGSAVDTLEAGQRVAVRVGHASDSVVDAAQCFPVPDTVGDEAAAWFALAKITAMGARAAEYQLGDSVLIIGAGPIGQLATRWAAASGVESIAVADLASGRLEHAKHGGATAVIDRPIEEALPAIIEANNGKRPRVVIDSTGHAQVFASALNCVDRFGKVVVLGDTGAPTEQHLTSDVILRGLTVVGAHDGHERPGWDAGRIYRLFFTLVGDGRFDVDGLITHRVSGEDARTAYELAMTQRLQTMGILFKWNEA